MPRQAAVAIENNFTKGLITEFSALNFPENACTETFNCIFGNRGRVTRRKGFDYEDGYSFETATRNGSVIREYQWKNVSGLSDVSFVVQQIGTQLYFYQVSSDGILSTHKHATTVNLSSFSPSGAPGAGTEACDFTSGKGKLFVSHPYLEPFYVEYDFDTNTFSTTQIDIEIRDFEGVDDGLDIDERPSTLSDAHEYNLYNQGWYPTVRLKGGSDGNPLTYWDSNRPDFPSNADVWWYYRDTSGILDEDFISRTQAGNTPAPKGHFILNPFDTDRSGAATAIGTVTESDSSYFRPASITFFAGRVWYAGVNYEDYASRIYFSQIIERDEQIGYCYQFDDPTKVDGGELLPSDGGIIVIQEIGNIIKLVPIQQNLIVIATNGVWAIGGGESQGFKANDYSVSKLSAIGANSAGSVIIVDGLPVWWSVDAIYALRFDQALGTLAVQNLTEETIQAFYDSIPTQSKKYAKGAYNSQEKVVQWLYRTTSADSVDGRYNYDAVLNLDTTTGAFYPWTIGDGDPHINGIVSVENLAVDGTDANQFFYFTSVHSSGSTYNVCYSKQYRNDYLDWYTDDSTGVDYDSYFVTGYKVHGEAQKNFQSNYIYVFSIIEEDSSCKLQGIWDYANDGDSGRYTHKQEIYLTKDYHSHSWRRLKIRGQGISLQYRFESVTGKPFNIVGWSAFETGNSDV